MTPLQLVIRIAARAAHDVVAEYRRLEPAAPRADRGTRRAGSKAEISCTSVSARDRWQPHQEAPASSAARIGFGSAPIGRDLR